MQIQRCFGCMEEITAYPCPNCGYDPNTAEHPTNALPPQTILNGRYLVGKVLGQGGFGITYIGFDLMLNTKVAIKEFYPSGQVVRNPMTRTTLNWEGSAQAQQMRRDGTETFLKEARKMARVSGIANVVTVREVFAQNETAYIAMEFIEGETLDDYLNKTGPLTWEQARKMFLPAVTAMEQVHKAGLIHRDLSPDNLMLQPDGTVKILDLGAAKDLNVNSGASSMVVAKSGFSPVEQYIQRGNSGPWTDVYAMAATMYYALTGSVPPASIERMDQDTIDWNVPSLKALPPQMLSALKSAMEVSARKRMQDMAPLKEAMEAAKSVLTMEPVAKTEAETAVPTVIAEVPKEKKPGEKTVKDGRSRLFLGIVVALLAVVIGAIAFGGGQKEAAAPVPSAQMQAETEVPTEATAETSAPTAAEVSEEETSVTEPAADYEDAYPSIQPGTYLTFGSYEQDNDLTNGAEPIEWLVLERDGSKALVISRYGLDAVPYHTKDTDITWEMCGLRTWLNGTFMDSAFTQQEQSAILTTDVDNSNSQGYSEYSTDGGNNTQDQIILLSVAEAEKYFGVQHNTVSGADSNMKSRIVPTAYAIARGAYTSGSNQTADGAAAGCWWLRSSGINQNYAGYVHFGGTLYSRSVDYSHGCIRPAMWLDLAEAENPASAQEESAKSVQAEVGSYITFGSYEQDNNMNNGTEPIEWLVLDRDGSKALVISRYGLNVVQYNTEYTDVTWESCSLRIWLNGSFMNRAFTRQEQMAILTTAVDNSNSQGYSEYSTDGGNNTQDQIFLLSYAETDRYYGVTFKDRSNVAARIEPTAYARAQGAFTSDSNQTADGAYAGWWWLRSPGGNQSHAAYVYDDGSLYHSYVNFSNACVRPAMWINLDSGIF